MRAWRFPAVTDISKRTDAVSTVTDSSMLRTAAWLLIVFSVTQFLVAKIAYFVFGWPEVLREAPQKILTKFASDAAAITVIYYLFFFCWLIFLPIPMLLATSIRPTHVLIVAGTSFGVLAAFCHMIGPSRWVFVVPALSQLLSGGTGPGSDDGTVVPLFVLQHQFAGVMIGEHHGNLLRAVWTLSLLMGAGAVLTPLTRIVGLFAALILLAVAGEQLGGPMRILTPYIGFGQLAWLLWTPLLARDLFAFAKRD